MADATEKSTKKKKSSRQQIYSFSGTENNDKVPPKNIRAPSKTITAVNSIFKAGEQPKTDKKEIWAWYCYDWANSPFAGVVIALLLPLLMSDLAEDYGCSLTEYGCDIDANNIENGELIQVKIGLLELKATSYAAAIVGIASLVQAIFYLFVGPIADFANYRTTLFRITSISAAICCCFFIFFGDKSLWQFVGFWTVLVTTLHGLSIIFINSWLPILVETHEDVVKACKSNDLNEEELKEIIEHKTDHLALVGFAWGYIGAIIVLLICLGILLNEPSAYIYDADTKYGSNMVFIEDSMQSFSELYAKRITYANLYFSVSADSYTYINGMHFVYNDQLNGTLFGSALSENSVNLDFGTNGVDEIIIHASSEDEHLCGISFHLIGDNDGVTAKNVGNATNGTLQYKISNDDQSETMIFGGISGEFGELNEEINITQSIAISQISLLFVNTNGKSTLFSRIGILINGIWFLIFALVSIKYLKHRPGPPLPLGENVFFFGMKQTINTLKKMKTYPTMFKYMCCYFLFSDGIGTLISCGVLFGRELLNMTNSQLAFMILEVYVFGTFGTFFFLYIEKKFHIRSKNMLCMHLLFMIILPIWPLIGLFPDSSFGLKSLTEMYVWTLLLAIHVGSLQSFSRSVFAQLIPIGHESEFFALYEVTDKGSSWIGPLVVAAVSDALNMRWSLFYVMIFFLIPLPFVWTLDMDKGRFEAGRDPKQVTRRASMLYNDHGMNEKDAKKYQIELENIASEERDLNKPQMETAIAMSLTPTDERMEAKTPDTMTPSNDEE